MREMTASTSSRLAARISSAWAQKTGGVRPFDHASWLPGQGENNERFLWPLIILNKGGEGGEATTHSSPLPWTYVKPCARSRPSASAASLLALAQMTG